MLDEQDQLAVMDGEKSPRVAGETGGRLWQIRVFRQRSEGAAREEVKVPLRSAGGHKAGGKAAADRFAQIRAENAARDAAAGGGSARAESDSDGPPPLAAQTRRAAEMMTRAKRMQGLGVQRRRSRKEYAILAGSRVSRHPTNGSTSSSS